jgi:hypothetical protein
VGYILRTDITWLLGHPALQYCMEMELCTYFNKAKASFAGIAYDTRRCTPCETVVSFAVRTCIGSEYCPVIDVQAAMVNARAFCTRRGDSVTMVLSDREDVRLIGRVIESKARSHETSSPVALVPWTAPSTERVGCWRDGRRRARAASDVGLSVWAFSVSLLTLVESSVYMISSGHLG